VICITHLPQIAAKGERNFCVTKTVRGKTTRTRVERLEGEERIGEIARMLGDAASQESLVYARRLVDRSLQE